MKRQTQTIDATGMILGRLATKIAVFLRGKHRPSFRPNLDEGDIVMVKNVDKIKVSGRKMEQKKYYRHTGYPGGLKEKPLGKAFAESPAEVLRKTVFGMLPKNKLRAEQIKRLKFQ